MGDVDVGGVGAARKPDVRPDAQVRRSVAEPPEQTGRRGRRVERGEGGPAAFGRAAPSLLARFPPSGGVGVGVFVGVVGVVAVAAVVVVAVAGAPVGAAAATRGPRTAEGDLGIAARWSHGTQR